MRAITGVVLGVGVLTLQGCPSAYHGAYNKETQRLEAEQRAAQARAAAAHSEARRYGSVVYFAVGSAVIDDDGQRELRWFVEKMQPYPEAVILVQGFADSTGNEPENRSLSKDRARTVASFLAGQGINASRIVTQGYGTESPAAANATAQGRTRNRRVEVTVR
jgi:outer membrane protein OmpA-like peptidoglycan-associated protein